MSTSRSVMAKRSFIGVVAVLIAIFALPQELRSSLPGPLGSADFRLGLDLAGGTQLDFRISETEMDEQEASLRKQLAEAKAANNADLTSALELDLQVLAQQRTNVVEAIRTVLERRINSLGVSEATITPSYVGSEKHLLVECPGVVDVQQCIATVGKTIQLEFKEEQTEATPEYASEVRAKAAAAERQLQTKESTLEKLGQDLGTQLGTAYEPGSWYMQDTLPKGLQPLWNATPGTIRRYEGAVTQRAIDENGKEISQDIPGIFLAELLAPRTQTGRVLNVASTAFAALASQEQDLKTGKTERTDLSTLPAPVQAVVEGLQPGQMSTATLADGSAQVLFVRAMEKGREQMDASHILIAYKGASGTDEAVTRTKEEARALADSLKKQLDGGADFATLAKQSDAESKATGGSLGAIARGTMVASFEKAAFALKQGAISAVVETPFGFHIIRSDKAPYTSPSLVSLDTLTVSGDGATARAAAIVGRLQRGEVTQLEDAIRVRFLYFSLQPVGWKDTPLDGKHFRSAGTLADPTTGLPVVQIAFDAEGGRLFQELTRRNIGKQLAIFVGGQLVSSPTVQGEISGGTAIITGSQTFTEAQNLAQDLNTGAIPAPIYLAGQRTVEPTLGSEALRTSLHAGVLGAVAVMLFLVIVYRMLGVLASVSLVAYAGIFLALLKLPLFLVSDQYVVLTLAGIAGMILSIGLAVDANVLIFERLKEELARGRSFKQAVELGFERAWPSIRDSNISTLITCAILFVFGTSIVRGFAVTLSLGVFISLFTGLVLTRQLANLVAKTRMADDARWFMWSSTKKS